MAALTKRQREVLDFLSNFIGSKAYSPSYEEIGEGCGVSSLATVSKHVRNLAQKGFIKYDPNRSRSIEIVPQKHAPKLVSVQTVPETALPLMGRIAAGRPVEALEVPETVSLNDITRQREVYALQVRGDSMQDEHIIEGDYVLVEKTNSARDGEIVVALVNGYDATLKRIYREGPQVRLQPSNATMMPIMVPAQAVQVQGRVVGILRKYA
jgi:repressor LexA